MSQSEVNYQSTRPGEGDGQPVLGVFARPPSREPAKPQTGLDKSANDVQTNHNEKRYRHTAEEVQLKPGLVHRE